MLSNFTRSDISTVQIQDPRIIKVSGIRDSKTNEEKQSAINAYCRSMIAGTFDWDRSPIEIVIANYPSMMPNEVYTKYVIVDGWHRYCAFNQYVFSYYESLYPGADSAIKKAKSVSLETIPCIFYDWSHRSYLDAKDLDYDLFLFALPKNQQLGIRSTSEDYLAQLSFVFKNNLKKGIIIYSSESDQAHDLKVSMPVASYQTKAEHWIAFLESIPLSSVQKNPQGVSEFQVILDEVLNKHFWKESNFDAGKLYKFKKTPLTSSILTFEDDWSIIYRVSKSITNFAKLKFFNVTFPQPGKVFKLSFKLLADIKNYQYISPDEYKNTESTNIINVSVDNDKVDNDSSYIPTIEVSDIFKKFFTSTLINLAYKAIEDPELSMQDIFDTLCNEFDIPPIDWIKLKQSSLEYSSNEEHTHVIDVLELQTSNSIFQV